MKKLHKKIGAMALAGMVVAAGIGVSGVRVFANDSASQIKVSEKDKERYKQEKYDVKLPIDRKYMGPAHELLGRDDKSLEKKIEEIGANHGFWAIKLSGKNGGINRYIRPLQNVIGKNNKLFKLPQAYFRNLKDFEEYLKKHEKQIERGMYKVRVGGINGIFKKV